MTYDRLTDDGFTVLTRATHDAPQPTCPACREPFRDAHANALRDHAATCEPLRVQMFARAYHIDHDPTRCIRLGCGQPVAGKRYHDDGTPDRAGSSVCYCQAHARELFAAHHSAALMLHDQDDACEDTDAHRAADPHCSGDACVAHLAAGQDDAPDDDPEPTPPDPPHWTTDAYGDDLRAERALDREQKGE